MVNMRMLTLILMSLALGNSASAGEKCTDHFKKAKINYPCMAQFEQFDSIQSLMPHASKLSCYGENAYPEPSIQISSNEFVFKDLDEKKKVATVKKDGDFVTFYFEVTPRRAFRFKQEDAGKCYLDSFNVEAGASTVVMDEAGCRAILVKSAEVCKGKAKEGDLSTLALDLVNKIRRNEGKKLSREDMGNLISNCRYHSCGADPVTKKMMPKFAASLLKPYKEIVKEREEGKSSGSGVKGH